MKRLLASLVLTFLGAAVSGHADIKPMALFSDHAVLQQGVPVPVWGSGTPGEKVTVTYAHQTQSTVVGADGRWMVKLDPLAAGTVDVLTMQGANKVVANDVITGDVWLGTGQSNMMKPVNYARDFAKEQPAANYPSIRFFQIPPTGAETPQTDCQGQWVACSPATVGDFSATAYFFARDLFQNLHQPIGVIRSCVGGTMIQSWMSLATAQALPEFEQLKRSAGPSNPKALAHLFNGMIAPIIPYAIKGAIWYQGEANSRALQDRYDTFLAAMVKSWRELWQQNFPFCWVQLPNFMAPQTQPGNDESWAVIRDSMLRATTIIPNSGMAINLGTGEDKNIHPHNKQEAGRRLSMWALADVYGKKDIASSGPLPVSHEIKGSEIVITFSHTDGGLQAKGGKVTGFAICGDDHKWVWADAKLDGNTVIVSSAEVPKPVAVRYAWANNPVFSLFNGQGIPATPFRTDAFPLKVVATMPGKGGGKGAKAAKATATPEEE